MAPICEFCHFDYIDRTDHSDCGPDAEETTVTESWAPIPDSAHYEVSDLGNVRSVTHTSIASNGIPRTIEGKPIARLTTENGSPYVSIRRDAAVRPTNRRIAALVLEAHAGPAPQGARPRVINGDRSDVRLANLEWAGPKPPKSKTPRVPRAATKRPAAPA
ncbi:NUMOD4 domain-containing protein, partial [Tsukamurella sp. MT6.1]